jgi:hypothetical protein
MKQAAELGLRVLLLASCWRHIPQDNILRAPCSSPTAISEFFSSHSATPVSLTAFHLRITEHNTKSNVL